MWYAGVACLIVIVVGAISSLIFSFLDTGNWSGNPDKPVDPDLLAPGVETIFCCWPSSCKTWMSGNGIIATNRRQQRRREIDDIRGDGDVEEMAAMKIDDDIVHEHP